MQLDAADFDRSGQQFSNYGVMLKRKSLLGLVTCAFVVPAITLFSQKRSAGAAPELSAADRTFVAKVSQGGMFEVEASKVAKQKAVEQDVVDIGFTEVHDHQLVGAKLKSTAASLGIEFPSELNAAFTKRLDRLKALASGKDFDDGYIAEMDAIHATDVAAFAAEAASGTNPALKAFAAETVLIVRRHIGALHAIPLPAK
jgi:putative membrane protein